MAQAGAEKLGRKKKSKRGGPPGSPGGYSRIAVQARPEWVAWVEAGAKHCFTDVAKLVDASLAEYLRNRGFNQERPERLV